MENIDNSTNPYWIIGFALLVLFFLTGVVKMAGSFSDVKHNYRTQKNA